MIAPDRADEPSSRAAPMPPMIIVVMGVTASGKTTVGKRLAARLGCPFYDADQFHPPENIDKMSRGEPLTDDDREPWLRALHDVMARHEREGTCAVVACSALKERYRQTLRGDLKTVRFLYLKGDPDVLQARLDRRKGHFMPRTMLPSQLAALEEPTDAIVVDAALPIRQIVDRAASALDVTPSPHEEERG